MAYKTPHKMAISFQASSTNPNDSTTYYIGGQALSLSTSTVVRLYMPHRGRITKVHLMAYCGGVGTAEDIAVYLRHNGATDYTLTTTMHWDSDVNTLFVENLNVPVVGDEYIQIKIVTPAWVGNPTGVYCNGNVILEVD